VILNAYRFVRRNKIARKITNDLTIFFFFVQEKVNEETDEMKTGDRTLNE
jgi:hypothetical protein